MLCSACQAPNKPDAERCASCGEAPLLDDRYQLEEIIGHGASGTTYRATVVGDSETLEDGNVVAIKELSIRKLESFKALELFEREATTLASLDHPNIPTYYEDFQIERGRNIDLYLVQEFIDGTPLDLSKNREDEKIDRLISDVSNALKYLHELNPPVIHRDIKPSNIIERKDGTYFLIDFGSVKNVISADHGSTMVGTVGYMAPEVLVGNASQATDLYGFAATLIALLTGTSPEEFVDETTHRIGSLHDVPIDERWKRKVEPLLSGHISPMPKTVWSELVAQNEPSLAVAAPPVTTSRETGTIKHEIGVDPPATKSLVVPADRAVKDLVVQKRSVFTTGTLGLVVALTAIGLAWDGLAGVLAMCVVLLLAYLRRIEW